MAKPTLKKFWGSFFAWCIGAHQQLFTVHWTGPMRHIPEQHCTPCPLCDGKSVYGGDGLPYWKARRLQYRITGPWDETFLRPVPEVSR